MLRLTGSPLRMPLCVAANAGWWITHDFRVQMHGFAKRSVFDLLIELCVGRHSLDGIRQVPNFVSLSVRHVSNIYEIISIY